MKIVFLVRNINLLSTKNVHPNFVLSILIIDFSFLSFLFTSVFIFTNIIFFCTRLGKKSLTSMIFV